MPELMLEIATPERSLLKEPVSEVQIPGKDGYFGVLPGAAALISELKPGVLTYTNASGAHHIAVLGGFAEVIGDRVMVLADDAKKQDEISTEQARKDLEKAHEIMNRPSDIDPAQALEDSLRAQALIDAASAK
jgi:F-type H+-transporting ATPase subunit epsilon